MNELDKLIDLLKTAIEAGQTFSLTADDIVISTSQTGIEVTINSPSIATEG